jgi:hypothetical protein
MTISAPSIGLPVAESSTTPSTFGKSITEIGTQPATARANPNPEQEILTALDINGSAPDPDCADRIARRNHRREQYPENGPSDL